MTDDRTLLEKAAKAAGIGVQRSRLDDPLWRDMLLTVRSPEHGGIGCGWNPLTDDGDAFRLAVKCAAQIHWHVGNVMVVAIDGFKPIDVRESYGEDMDVAAATRRAIVRAAAALAP